MEVYRYCTTVAFVQYELTFTCTGYYCGQSLDKRICIKHTMFLEERDFRHLHHPPLIVFASKEMTKHVNCFVSLSLTDHKFTFVCCHHVTAPYAATPKYFFPQTTDSYRFAPSTVGTICTGFRQIHFLFVFFTKVRSFNEILCAN